MPWTECNLMDERLKFIIRLLDGDKMPVLCRAFGISGKTGYKILKRYNACRLDGLTDRPVLASLSPGQSIAGADREADRPLPHGSHPAPREGFHRHDSTISENSERLPRTGRMIYVIGR